MKWVVPSYHAELLLRIQGVGPKRSQHWGARTSQGREFGFLTLRSAGDSPDGFNARAVRCQRIARRAPNFTAPIIPLIGVKESSAVFLILTPSDSSFNHHCYNCCCASLAAAPVLITTIFPTPHPPPTHPTPDIPRFVMTSLASFLHALLVLAAPATRARLDTKCSGCQL